MGEVKSIEDARRARVVADLLRSAGGESLMVSNPRALVCGLLEVEEGQFSVWLCPKFGLTPEQAEELADELRVYAKRARDASKP